MSVYRAIQHQIAVIRAGQPAWFGGKPTLRLPPQAVLIDEAREHCYVTMEDLQKAFAEQEKGATHSAGERGET